MIDLIQLLIGGAIAIVAIWVGWHDDNRPRNP